MIQVYRPTTAATDEEMERLYQDLSQAVKQVPNGDMLLVMGDFNAKSAEENRLRCHPRLGCMA